MRIELRDINGQSYAINTANGKLAAEWFAEYLPGIHAATKMHMPWQIWLWPSDNAESELLGNRQQWYAMIDSKSFAELEDLFRNAKEIAERREKRIAL